MRCFERSFLADDEQFPFRFVINTGAIKIAFPDNKLEHRSINMMMITSIRNEQNRTSNIEVTSDRMKTSIVDKLIIRYLLH